MAGPPSLWLLTAPTLAFLLHVLIHHETASVILFALIALEKFAQTSENKLSINEKLCSLPVHPLLRLESWLYDDAEDFDKQQVGLCAQWCLDNLFMVEGRQFTYETVDMSQSRAVLNNYDTSEYLKITADGLQARCDTSSFESARCTFCVHSGCWYYEVTVVTSGVMQIGWATKNSRFLNHEGYGIGDDACSVAYDGCRCLLWHDARATSHHHRRWGPGDVLGALIDLDLGHCVFSLNGDPLSPFTDLFKNTKSGFFAAASFMSFQQCRFNFGASPFKFPPSRWRYQCFNDHGTLSPAQRSIIPRHMKLERLREGSVCEDACTLCFDKPASVTLLPCSHRGFCSVCAQQLTQCPLCRSSIMSSVT